jgi:hypothetical protein
LSDARLGDEIESDGALFWSATLIDEKSGQKFKIRANEDEIRVFPTDEDFGLGTFARFYEFVCENIDERANPVVQNE